MVRKLVSSRQQGEHSRSDSDSRFSRAPDDRRLCRRGDREPCGGGPSQPDLLIHSSGAWWWWRPGGEGARVLAGVSSVCLCSAAGRRMAKSSADDAELRKACEAAVEGGGSKETVVLSIRVAKSRGVWGKAGRLGRHMAKPRVLALTSMHTLFPFSSPPRGSAVLVVNPVSDAHEHHVLLIFQPHRASPDLSTALPGAFLVFPFQCVFDHWISHLKARRHS